MKLSFSARRQIILVGSLFVFATNAYSQLVINEICASNSTTIEDQYGDSSDWIELYNSSESSITLEGYFLSDDTDNLVKWSFPSVTIPAEERLLIFASGRDEIGTVIHTNFKLSADGESVILSKTDGSIADQVDFSTLEEDQSMGRLQDGSPEWVIFDVPTPDMSNDLSVGTGFTAPPFWETDGCFFDDSVLLTINHSNASARVFYTTDGRLPTLNDQEYLGAIMLDTTTAIRAIAIVDDQLPSVVLSKTFFVDDHHTLPVLSIMGDPDDLWSWERGILVDGGPNAEEEWPFWGANFWSDLEVPVNLEYFTASGDLAIEWRADMKAHGGRAARTNPMKSLRLLTKKKYGSRTINHRFFENRERTQFKRLVLRNASGDYNNGHCRDAFLARYFIDSELKIDVLAHQPLVVYINGVYYGVENLREKSDEYYLRYNYGVDVEQLDLLEEDTLVTTGDFVLFDSMYQYMTSNDLSNQAAFDYAITLVDHENIGDAFIVQSALNNGDWLHNNTKYWRERKEGARWRYFIYDMDIAMGRHGWSDSSINNFGDLINNYADTNRHVNIFTALLENEGYRFDFVNRYADLLNTIFRPEIFRKEVDRTLGELEPEMPRHFTRWTWPGFDLWKNDRTPKLYEYLELRPAYARDDIREYFDLPNQVNLQLSTYPEGAGVIKINTIDSVGLPWDGIYFNGVPVTLTIIPSPGYEFDRWQSTYTITDPDKNLSITYNFEQDDEIVAFFTSEKAGVALEVFATPDQELQVNLGLEEPTNLAFSVFDLQGRLIQYYSEQLFAGGNQQTTLQVPDLANGIYILRAESASEQKGVKFLVIK